ncbi:PDZ domain-containing protein [Schnuerera ultunensis]|uniref:Cell division topological determinant MinJ n=1 Tax=[Clostridium] ultunense Esp TaxID=1288971 RepID=A0A1M4PJJ1_9FIRM|nr:PDZ domain-containing protein [Schnuerera ultunensis]SHD75607.1 Cell division topological determinant MinJ [[Clostridium] ultunense Esp]
MYPIFQIVYYSIYNILSILKSPFFWIVVGIIYLQYRKIGEMEKGILGEYQKSPIYNVFISTLYGLMGGILGSIIFITFGISINPKDFYFILPLALLLSMVHPRFMCFSYAGGIVSLVSLILGWPSINVSEIMFVIGVLHLVESFLILVDGRNNKIPIFMEKQREIIGGFTMNRFWPVPFSIFVNNGYVYPITIMAILGYGDFALANFPEKKSRETASALSLFSIILLILSRLSIENHFYKYVAAIFAPLAHEVIIAIGRRKEEKGDYLFTPVEHGLRVLDTLPNSVGGKIGLNPGDIILSINGHRVYSREDIEDILFFRPKFIWLDVFDIKKGMVTKEYKNYQVGINNLGIVVVSNIPDQIFIVEESKAPVVRLINRFKNKKSKLKN